MACFNCPFPMILQPSLTLDSPILPPNLAHAHPSAQDVLNRLGIKNLNVQGIDEVSISRIFSLATMCPSSGVKGTVQPRVFAAFAQPLAQAFIWVHNSVGDAIQG